MMSLTDCESLLLSRDRFLASLFFFLWRGRDSRIISSSSKVGSQWRRPFCRKQMRRRYLETQTLTCRIISQLQYTQSRSVYRITHIIMTQTCTEWMCVYTIGRKLIQLLLRHLASAHTGCKRERVPVFTVGPNVHLCIYVCWYLITSH